MIKESKYCTDVMKKHFNRELVMTKKDGEDFGNSTKCWICNNVDVNVDVTVWSHCYITGKYKCSAHRDCNIMAKLNHKIPIIYHNLQNYENYLVMQELDKFHFKINVIPNGLEKYMSFNINKLIFIDSFHFLSSPLDSLVNNLGKDYFKYLSQEFYFYF